MRRRIPLLALTGVFVVTALAAPVLPASADPRKVSHSMRGDRDHGHRGEPLRYGGRPCPPGAYDPAPRQVAYRRGYYGPPPGYYVPRGRKRYQKQDTLPSNVLSGAIGAAIMYGAYRVYNEKKHRNRGFDGGDEGQAPLEKQPSPDQKPAGVEKYDVEPAPGLEENAELP